MPVSVAIIGLVVVCVVVSVAPQIALWYVSATGSTFAVTEELMRQVTNTSLELFLGVLVDAENVLGRLVEQAGHERDICSPTANRVARDFWRWSYTDGTIASRRAWFIGAADAWLGTSGVYVQTSPFFPRQAAGVWWADQGNLTLAFSWVEQRPGSAAQSLGPAVMTIEGFNSSQRPWYAVAAQNPGRVAWDPFGIALPDKCLAMSAVSTYASPEHPELPLCGVVVVGLYITQIEAQLRQHKVGKTGNIWFVDMDGLLVASTRNASVLDTDPATGAVSRVAMARSSDGATAAAGRRCAELVSRGSLDVSERVEVAGSPGYMLVTRTLLRPGVAFPAMHAVVFIPEADYFAGIRASTYRTLGITVGLLAAAVLASGALSVALTVPLRRIARQMSRASQLA
eukprot:m51a1_g13549 hypothetical protein (399) ;mRNA; r:194-1466